MSSEFISSESGPGMGRLAAHWEGYTIAGLGLAALTRARKSWVALQCLSTRLSAIDPPLSRRTIYVGCSSQKCFASTTNDAIHRSICFVLRVDEAVGDGP